MDDFRIVTYEHQRRYSLINPIQVEFYNRMDNLRLSEPMYILSLLKQYRLAFA